MARDDLFQENATDRRRDVPGREAQRGRGEASEIVGLLSRIEQGDCEAVDQLVTVLEAELQRLMAERWEDSSTKQRCRLAVLVQEFHARLAEASEVESAAERLLFLDAAAMAVQRILTASVRGAKRLPTNRIRPHIEMDIVPADESLPPDDLLALDTTIQQLAELDSRAARIARLRCFAGLSILELAVVLGVSRTHAELEWTYIKAWIFSRLRGDAPSD